MENDGCDFCQIASGKTVAHEVLRTEGVVGFFPRSPATLGHMLLIPRTHVPDIWELSPQLARMLAEWTVKVAQVLRSQLHPHGLNVIQSNGIAASQSVMHVHIHLVPRWEGDAMPRIWPTSSTVPGFELDEAAAGIRGLLDGLHDGPGERGAADQH